MVDLRGIEEIARLHLLHNVSRRGAAPQEGGTPAGTDPSVDVRSNERLDARAMLEDDSAPRVAENLQRAAGGR